jgi:hypothetical protein
MRSVQAINQDMDQALHLLKENESLLLTQVGRIRNALTVDGDFSGIDVQTPAISIQKAITSLQQLQQEAEAFDAKEAQNG